MIEKVNLAEKFEKFSDHWSPKIAGTINDSEVKLVKLLGELIWHHHDNADEMFLIIQGHLTMRIQDQPDVELDPGAFVIIPQGVEHMPVAEQEVKAILLEPKGTLNTGHVVNDRTVADLDRI